MSSVSVAVFSKSFADSSAASASAATRLSLPAAISAALAAEEVSATDLARAMACSGFS
jgi:hypothetical protein